jgi:hypothetical protein
VSDLERHRSCWFGAQPLLLDSHPPIVTFTFCRYCAPGRQYQSPEINERGLLIDPNPFTLLLSRAIERYPGSAGFPEGQALYYGRAFWRMNFHV